MKLLWRGKPGYVRQSLTVVAVLTTCLIAVAADDYRLRQLNSQQAQEIILRLSQVRTMCVLGDADRDAKSKLFWGKLDAERRVADVEVENAELRRAAQTRLVMQAGASREGDIEWRWLKYQWDAIEALPVAGQQFWYGVGNLSKCSCKLGVPREILRHYGSGNRESALLAEARRLVQDYYGWGTVEITASETGAFELGCSGDGMELMDHEVLSAATSDFKMRWPAFLRSASNRLGAKTARSKE